MKRSSAKTISSKPVAKVVYSFRLSCGRRVGVALGSDGSVWVADDLGGCHLERHGRAPVQPAAVNPLA
jgi:hypothetical protein